MATQNTAVPTPVTQFNLEQWLQMAAANEVDDLAIYEHLCPPLPPNLVTRWLARIAKIEGAPRPASMKPAEWRGKISRAKGHAFERMLASILKTVRFFNSWRNVTTTTNEIDLLVEIGMGCQISPIVRQWGSHFICECKLVADGVNATWIGKLNTVLQTHGASVGVLISSKGPPRGKVRTQIHILAVMNPPRVIVCVSLDDLRQCASGGNFLRLITARYLETKTGANGLITG
jgi:hypothetical protein